MTAAPLNNGLAKVRKLLPVRIRSMRPRNKRFDLLANNGRVFCVVPIDDNEDAQARAELIRDAMNEME